MAVILFSVSIIILAQILRIFELPYEDNRNINAPDLQDFGSAIWLIVITSTTVGYGDIYPHTIGGQITCIIAAFWGTFIVSLLVLIISQVFTLEDKEAKAISYIKKSRTAATAIGQAFKFYLYKKKFYLHKLKTDPKFGLGSSSYLKMLTLQIKTYGKNNCISKGS